MVYKGKGKKGSKYLGIGNAEIMNDECRECIYRKKGTCTGHYDAINPCLFSKTQENDTVDNWVQY